MVITLIVGLVFQPLKDGAAGWWGRRTEEERRRWQVQYDTLLDLGSALEDAAVGRNMLPGHQFMKATERARLLAFRVRDEQLRTGVETMLATKDGDAWGAAEAAAVRRLGEVLREM